MTVENTFPLRHVAGAAALGTALVLVAALHPTAAQSVPTYTVGNDAACDFATLQTAINMIPPGGNAIIRVSSAQSGFKTGRVAITDRNVHISGGYDNCSDTSADAGKPALIESNGTLPAVTVSTQGGSAQRQVTLETLRIEKGRGTFGGGLRVDGRAQVRLSNVGVRNNVATQGGGGVYVGGSSGASLSIEFDSVIENNDGGLYGGGLYCVAGSIDFRGGRIAGNIATAHGGGVFLDGCTMTGSVPGSRAIVDNDVDYERHTSGSVRLDGRDASGAGMYVRNGSIVELGSAASTTLIADNVVRDTVHDGIGPHYTVDRGEGGGLLLVGASRASLINAHIARNVASIGGGVNVINTSRFELSRSVPGCVALPGYAGCASLLQNVAYGYDAGFTGCLGTPGNWAGHGGALHLQEGSSAVLDGVRVIGNRVTQTDGCAVENHYRYPWGSAFMIRDSAVLDIYNTLVHANGGDEADDIIHVHHYGRFRAFHSTIALNRASIDATLRTSGDSPRVGLYSTILHEPNVTLFANDGASNPFLRLDCVRASNLGPLQSPSFAIVERSVTGATGFVNVAAGDFRLADGSAAIDKCDGRLPAEYAVTGRLVHDLGGQRRPLFTGSNPQLGWDIGAFEKQVGTVATLSDLEVEIADEGSTVPAGVAVRYVVTLRNKGPRIATNAGFSASFGSSLRLPMTLIPLEQGWTCTQQTRDAVCRYTGSLSSGGTAAQVAFQLTAPATPGQVTSSVHALSPPLSVDPEDLNNRASVTTTIGAFLPSVFADSFED